jgi:hypothetical protein
MNTALGKKATHVVVAQAEEMLAITAFTSTALPRAHTVAFICNYNAFCNCGAADAREPNPSSPKARNTVPQQIIAVPRME